MKGRENLIDYPAVWAAKSAALEAGFAAGQTHPDFATFAKAASPALRRFATFQAIAETLNGAPWQTWPAALRDPATARADAVRVRYHLYLQWLCETRLAAAAGDLRIGLIRDLAIGAAPDGAEIWAHQDLYATGVSVGAPPDPLGPQGQVWGLPPLDPHRIAKDDYAFHADLFAANMRHAGGLRIDHALGLMRQFWVPDGADGSAGAYVSFPFDELMAVLARESRKAQCLIIGEDLGTVPDGFRERMSAAHALSYRVLTFERRGAGFIPPADYPALAVACVATHDLPPLAGWWSGVDIDERAALVLLSPEDAASERAARAADKAALLAALGRPADSGPATSPALAAAVHAFIAATPCALTMIQAEDLAGETVPVNLPGTDAERPNWRRRINVAVEDVLDGERATAILQALGPRALRP